MVIHKSQFFKGEYDRENKTIRTEFSGIPNVQTIIENITKIIQFSKNERVHHCIINLSKSQGTFTGAADFIEKEYYPKMIQNGVKSFAIVLPNDVFTKYSASVIQKKLSTVEVAIFPGLAEAEKWTMSKKVLS